MAFRKLAAFRTNITYELQFELKKDPLIEFSCFLANLALVDADLPESLLKLLVLKQK